MNKFTRHLLLYSTVFLSAAGLYADTIDQGTGVEERDIQAIREWINSKRQVTVGEKGGALSISGEVRTEMQATYEKSDGVSLRGARTPFGIPHETFDVEVNLMLDYRTDRTWASVKLEFDNDAGIFNGTLNKLKLERAYWAVRFAEGDTYTVDAIAGRRRINAFVDTKIEGDSFFDGILIQYDQGVEYLGNAYIHAGAFVIDERHRQFGYLAEIGLLDIRDTGIYAKYLVIDWKTKDFHNAVREQRFNFVPNQFLLGYKFIPSRFKKTVKLYAAFLFNPCAHRLAITNHKRANLGGYVGVSMGELKKQGDWALDASYQAVQAQAVPDFDAGGLGLGNASGAGLYTVNLNGTGGPTTRKTAAGNNNFRGYNISLEYMFTNALILIQSWTQTQTLDRHIGPFRRFAQYEMEFNYAF